MFNQSNRYIAENSGDRSVGKRTGYLVLREGWEYNDEYYYRLESGGGHPETMFLTPEAAQKVADELNAREFSDLEVGSYAPDGDIGYLTTLDREELSRRLTEITGQDIEVDEDSWGGPYIPGNLSLEQLKQVADLFPDLRFFTVQQVGIEK